MILQALCGYYDRVAENSDNDIAPPGYARTPITSCIVLDKQGNVRHVNDMTKQSNKKRIPDMMITPQQPKRAGSRPQAAFLCENANFLFGIYEDQAGADYRFTASREVHEIVLSGIEDDGARAVLAFFDKRKQGTHEYEGIDTSKLNNGGNIVFRLQHEFDYIHTRPAIKAAWERHQARLSADSKIGQCLVTGDMAPIARIHGNIGGFGQDKPTVVGFNQDSFTSYHKEQGDNAPISENAAFKYVTALNLLLSDRSHSIRLHGDKIVFWAERHAPLEENAISALMEDAPIQPDVDLDEVHSLKMASIMKSLYAGKRPEELDLDSQLRFYILGVSSNKTRLVIRFFHINTFGELVARMQLHYNDIQIHGPSWEKEHPSIFRILLESAVLKKSDNVPAPLRSALMRSILGGTSYPNSLIMAMLIRIRAEAGSSATSAINRTRIGVLKGCLNRTARINNTKEMMSVSLNEDDKTISYLLGRLFALLEKAQYDALGKVNASIVDKYLNVALASPQQVFPSLLSNAENHFSKSGKYYTKKQIRELMNDIPSSGFPKTFNAEDQARFLVGYYHQQQAFFTNNDTKEQPDLIVES